MGYTGREEGILAQAIASVETPPENFRPITKPFSGLATVF